MVPKSLLNQLRRDLVAQLDELPRAPLPDPWPPSPHFPRCWRRSCGNASDSESERMPARASRVALCALPLHRPDRGGRRVGASRTIYADYQDIKEYATAVAAARRGGAAIYLATPRIEKPFEANLFRYLAKLGADGILVRNAGGLYFFAERSIPFVADFSLNAANPLTVELFKSRGRRSGHGLVRPELGQLLRPARRRAAGLAGGGHPSADPHVPHGALRLTVPSSRPEPTRPTAAVRATTTTSSCVIAWASSIL